MATYYAWSKFAKGVNEWNRVEGYIMPGEKITKDDIKVSDEEWQALIDVGAVRTEKYPDIPEHVSPAEYYSTHNDDEVTESEEVPAPEPTGTGAPPMFPKSDTGSKVES